MFPYLVALFFCVLSSTVIHAQTSLISTGATWKYRDNGSNQGTAWRDFSFNDSSWSSGAAELGYGDGDEATVVSYGSNPNNKYITTYFRSSFNVTNPSSFVIVNLRIKRDDGAVVYLNGTEVYRTNMPAGNIAFDTFASGSADDDGATFQLASINPSLLQTGTNVLAVEIHQHSLISSDISFDLDLTGFTAASVVRGPYLQTANPTSLYIRWRTNISTNSRVRYGTNPSNLNLISDDSDFVFDHVVRLTGLSPNTTYYYSVGTTTATLAGDATYFFITPPAANTFKPTHIWVLGDAGTANADQIAVRNAYTSVNGTRYTDLILLLGDNAYQNGTDSEYQSALYDIYPTYLRQSVLWPTIGNHDTAQSGNPPATLPYFEMFTLPTNAESGGIASGTEKYFSFDYSNIHFVCLDSMTSDRSAGGAMLTWLENDLSANTKDWVIAFWHHPPYSKGTHDSDNDPILTEMRANALPILEAHGVDLVLTGHSHVYERSFFIDGHYGTTTTFTNSMKKNGGDGRQNGNGAYTKTQRAPVPHQGAVYVVSGSAGQAGSGPLNHPAMFISLSNLGSFVLDINGNRLDAKFIRETGATADYFTIIKGTATDIEMESFEAFTNEKGTLIRWKTGREIDNLGFRVYRETNGQTKQLNKEIIAGSALIAGEKTMLEAGNNYELFDAKTKENKHAVYWIESVATDGETQMFGPIQPKKITDIKPVTKTLPQSLSDFNKTSNENAKTERQFVEMKTAPSNEDNHLQVSSKQSAKITVSENGWYRVTKSELNAIGFNTKQDPRLLKMFVNGLEIPILVNGETDASFDENDSIEFYGFGLDTPTTSANVYWLVNGDDVGKRLERISAIGQNNGAKSFSYTLEKKERKVYFSALRNGEKENFFGSVITNTTVEEKLNVTELDLTSNFDSVLEIALQGLTEQFGNPDDHQVKVALNGVQIGTIIFDGKDHKIERITIPKKLLREGINVLQFAAIGGAADVSLLDYVRLTYSHKFIADKDSLRSVFDGTQKISGFSSNEIRAFDVTNPFAPTGLIGNVELEKDSFSLTLDSNEKGVREVLTITEMRINKASSIKLNEPSSWTSQKNGADFVITSHRKFFASLKPLIELRQSQGLRVALVDIEDVYDEFNFGIKDAKAIKSFLLNARQKWQTPPRYILLVGDASFDPRNYLRLSERDFVPTKLVDTNLTETSSDDWFADFDDDGKAEMAVGRLPFFNDSEVALYVSKVLKYEQTVQSETTTKKVLLVSDKKGEFDFETATDEIKKQLPSNVIVSEIKREKLDDKTAHKQIIKSINSGQTFVNYFGHGSLSSWNGGVFTNQDALNLQNENRLPIFISMTCLNGLFQGASLDSLSESLLKAEQGGAIAVWSSSSVSTPDGQTILSKAVWQNLFDKKIERLGDITLEAKSKVGDVDTRRTWILFGDPTLKLR